MINYVKQINVMKSKDLWQMDLAKSAQIIYKKILQMARIVYPCHAHINKRSTKMENAKTAKNLQVHQTMGNIADQIPAVANSNCSRMERAKIVQNIKSQK